MHTELLTADSAEGRGVILTQLAIANRMGVSRQRIFGIEQRALEKLKRAIEREASIAKMTPKEWLFGN
jgi:DNA-directed RNA polymerase sigma subunit (sigma70/sigma32)